MLQNEQMYKILSSIDNAVKNNIRKPIEIFDLNFIGVSENEFPAILDKLIKSGYIKGMKVEYDIYKNPRLALSDIGLTALGYSYIENF